MWRKQKCILHWQKNCYRRTMKSSIILSWLTWNIEVVFGEIYTTVIHVIESAHFWIFYNKYILLFGAHAWCVSIEKIFYSCIAFVDASAEYSKNKSEKIHKELWRKIFRIFFLKFFTKGGKNSASIIQLVQRQIYYHNKYFLRILLFLRAHWANFFFHLLRGLREANVGINLAYFRFNGSSKCGRKNSFICLSEKIWLRTSFSCYSLKCSLYTKTSLKKLN